MPMKRTQVPILSDGLVALLKAKSGSETAFLGEKVSRPPSTRNHTEGSHCKEVPNELLKGSKQWFSGGGPEPTKKWYDTGLVNSTSRERRDPQSLPYDKEAGEASYRNGRQQQLVARAMNGGNITFRDGSMDS